MTAWQNNFDLIGYLVNGRFQCVRCSRATECPVYRINVGIYSQCCSICGELVVDGARKARGEPLCLFDPPLTKDDFLDYRERTAAAKVKEDWEEFARVEREMVRTLLAGLLKIPTDQLADCVRIVRSVLNQDNPRY